MLAGYTHKYQSLFHPQYNSPRAVIKLITRVKFSTGELAAGRTQGLKINQVRACTLTILRYISTRFKEEAERERQIFMWIFTEILTLALFVFLSCGKIYVNNTIWLDQDFSTSEPLPSGGPQEILRWATGNFAVGHRKFCGGPQEILRWATERFKKLTSWFKKVLFQRWRLFCLFLSFIFVVLGKNRSPTGEDLFTYFFICVFFGDQGNHWANNADSKVETLLVGGLLSSGPTAVVHRAC